jgi:hypothetical protein
MGAWQWTGAAAAVAVAAGGLIWSFNRKEPPRPATGGGGSLITELEETAGSDSNTSSKFHAARDSMLAGDFGKARQFFGEIGANPGTLQPTRNWARFNSGLCSLFIGDLADARASYAVMATEDLYSAKPEAAELAHFFKDTSRWLNAEGIVQTKHIADLPADSMRAIGLLAAGLKNWYGGDAPAAAEFLRAFDAAAVPADWIRACKRLAQGYLSDAATIAGLQFPDVSKMTADAADAALTRARGEAARLTQPGPPKDKTMAEVEAFAVRVTARKDELAASSEGNHFLKVNGEIKLIRDTNTAAAVLGESYRFGDAATKLKGLPVNTPEAVKVREAHLAAWRKAEEFLDQLTKDLSRQPVQSSLELPAGVLSASVSANGTSLTFSPGQGAETKIPVNKIPPAKLIDLALLTRERITDSDDYYRRSELIYSFALRTGLTATAESFGEALGSELRRFREQLMLLNNIEFTVASPK